MAATRREEMEKRMGRIHTFGIRVQKSRKVSQWGWISNCMVLEGVRASFRGRRRETRGSRKACPGFGQQKRQYKEAEGKVVLF